MPYYALKYYEEAHVGFISLIAPMNSQQKVGNLAIELSDLCSQISSDNETRVILLTSASENVFDMAEDLIPGMLVPDEGVETMLLSLAEPIASLDQPVIAAINGDAIGQGLELLSL